ncbi:EexN family lipoprotein [Parashewanella tropica]|uniref:EexN family lipoprotein n=1 Tax=Parashewanella tropica TaxID=2547970 RepID=UPI00105A97DE|nr:EexN family lipoprotein [Parashewanella tropica]
MKAINLILVSLTISLVAGCSKMSNHHSQQNQAHDVAWFKQHQKILMQTLTQCSNNPAKYRNHPECINAQQAANDIVAGDPVPLPADMAHPKE